MYTRARAHTHTNIQVYLVEDGAADDTAEVPKDVEVGDVHESIVDSQAHVYEHELQRERDQKDEDNDNGKDISELVVAAETQQDQTCHTLPRQPPMSCHYSM